MTRKWFQLHLITALFLMLAAGALMLLNFEPVSEQTLINNKFQIASRVDNWMILPAFYSYYDNDFYDESKAYGWPMPFVYKFEYYPAKILKGSLLVNFAAWSFILLTIAIACECRIRPPPVPQTMTRRWFQIHLWTLLICVLWCATMQHFSQNGINLSATKPMPGGWVCVQEGFPFCAFEEIRGSFDGELLHYSKSYPANLVIDLVFWIVSVFALGFVYRREIMKP